MSNSKKYAMPKTIGTEVPKLHPDYLFVKFDFETVDECLGSYSKTVDTKNGKFTVGVSSLEEAKATAIKNYKDDPDGVPGFEVLNATLCVIASFAPGELMKSVGSPQKGLSFFVFS